MGRKKAGWLIGTVGILFLTVLALTIGLNHDETHYEKKKLVDVDEDVTEDQRKLLFLQQAVDDLPVSDDVKQQVFSGFTETMEE